jgi:pimeloyl-ACP methyl ester carboxylesterase
MVHRIRIKVRDFLQGEETMKYLGRIHQIAGGAVARAGTIMKVSRSFPPEFAHRRTKPFTPFSLEKLLRNVAVLVTACAVWLGLLSSLGHAQTETSRTIQKEHTMTQSEATQRSSGQAADKDAIRPFHVSIPEEALVDLRRRIAATRWPDKETVADQSQGAQLANLQELVRYWATDYDWRKGEAKLNAFPQFMTRIDGVDIHFIHVKSRHPNALPLIVTHGWPGSVFEQIKLIGPLTDPTRYGGRAEDAFDVVIPSLPGYGFSARPTETGWDVERIGRTWDVLMKRLGYTRYVAQGGDWGAGVVEAMGRQAPAGLLGIHTNLPAVFPPDAAAAIASGGPAPAGLSEKERAAFDDVRRFLQNGGWGYYQMMTARPQAVRLRPDGLARRPRRVDARAPGVRGVDVRQGSPAVADGGRGAGQLHAVLADEQLDLGGAAVLGERRRQPDQRGRPEDRRDLGSGGHHGVSGGGFPRPGDVGPARLPQPDLLQRGRPGRPLRGLGTAATFF